MKNFYSILIIIFIISFSLVKGQASFTELNLQGKEAIKAKNNETAEKCFYESIKKNKDADSYYQLSKLYLPKTDSHLKNLGYEYISQALLLEPNNFDYRYLYIDYLEFFRNLSKREEEYRKVYLADPTQSKAIFKLAEMKFKIYERYRDYRVDSELWIYDEEVFPIDMTKEVQVDLDSAEYFYKKGLSIDSTNYEGLFGIVRMYQSTVSPERAIEYLKKIAKYYPDDKDVHLQLGVYCYKKKRLDESFRELQKGLSLMGAEEREDFVYNSVIKMLEPKYSSLFRKMSKEEIAAFIDKWWKVSDPLYLTETNERLMEHYVRVAYANLQYSSPAIDLIGWKSERGQVYISYGEPDRKMKLAIDKTHTFVEMWEYNNMPGFRFMGVKNYYKLSVLNGVEDLWNRGGVVMRGRPGYEHPSFPGGRFDINSLDDFNMIRMQKVQSYQPVLYGSKLKLDFRTYYFSRLTGKPNGNIETYVAYSVPTKDTTYSNEIKDFTHEIGVFFFDQNFEPLAQTRNTIKDSEIRKIFSPRKEIPVNCRGFGVKPGKVSFAFDLRRTLDSNYFTNRKVIAIPLIKNSVLGMSDLVFTNNIEFEKDLPFGMKRSEISFYPNLNNRFKNGEKFYIYYEVYNLKMDENKEGAYEQVITIRPKGEEGISLKKIVKGITTLFTGEEGTVSLTTNYRSKEENTQVYLQLDISGYKPGKYDLIITINDKISGKKTEKEVDLEII